MRTYRPVNLSVLWFVIVLNLFIFVLELITGGGSVGRSPLIPVLGLTPAFVLRQPWTVITSMFVHGSLWHILFNTISLYFLGSFVIRAAGEKSFLAVFLLGGLAGNLLFVLLAHPLSTGIGASGAIYALGGALAVLVPRVPVLIFPIPVPVPLWAAIIIFLFLSFVPGIAWEAHLGGLLLGLIAGLILRKKRRVYYF